MSVATRAEFKLTNIGTVPLGAPHGIVHGDSGVSLGDGSGGNNVVRLAVPEGSRYLLALRNIIGRSTKGAFTGELKLEDSELGNTQPLDFSSYGSTTATVMLNLAAPVLWLGSGDFSDVLVLVVTNVDDDDIRIFAQGVYWDINTLREAGGAPNLVYA